MIDTLDMQERPYYTPWSYCSYLTLDASVHVASVDCADAALRWPLSHWARTSRLLKHMRLLLVRFTLLMVHIFYHWLRLWLLQLR